MARNRRFLLAATATLGPPSHLLAQTLPDSARIHAGLAAEGTTDAPAWRNADRLRDVATNSVVVESRMSAGGQIARAVLKVGFAACS
jgi:tripartite-type tricarboxylate transporter receptor subunit TctC